MQTFLETIIYLIAIMGIILTMTSFYEKIIYRNYNNDKKTQGTLFYKFKSKNSSNDDFETIVFSRNVNKSEVREFFEKIRDCSDEEFEELVGKIK